MKNESIEQAFVLNPNASLTTLKDAYNECFEKLSALVQLSLCDDFSDYPKEMTYHYHTIMSDIIEALRDLHREIMQKLNKRHLC
jgi:hypothetical protein